MSLLPTTNFMRQIYSLVVMIFMNASVFAQTIPVISGRVSDEQNNPLQGATVSLLKATDSTVVKFTATDKKGNYEFVINKPGCFFLAVTSVGFNKGYSKTFEYTADKAVTVGTVVMNKATKDLSNVKDC